MGTIALEEIFELIEQEDMGVDIDTPLEDLLEILEELEQKRARQKYRK